jgi:hypothetical protein
VAWVFWGKQTLAALVDLSLQTNIPTARKALTHKVDMVGPAALTAALLQILAAVLAGLMVVAEVGLAVINLLIRALVVQYVLFGPAHHANSQLHLQEIYDEPLY